LAGILTSQALLDAAVIEQALRNTPTVAAPGKMVRFPWDLVSMNEERLRVDLPQESLKSTGEIHPSAVLNHPERIRLDGGRVEALAVLDAADGPIVIEEGAVVRSHAVVCGPAFIDRGTIVNPHAYLHGGCSIGPVCKVGGEVDACIFAGYSNKQHEGFLGHAYVGEWVNLGASTVNSDLKNTYGNVRCAPLGVSRDTGLRFFGAIIADHAKSGIGTQFPTGGCLGFAANAAASRLLPKHVPSFAWLTDEGAAAARPEALLATARTVMERRKRTLTKAEQELFLRLPGIASHYEQAFAWAWCCQRTASKRCTFRYGMPATG
jgi:UDP-N-acetylglucosamine diphosphorylase/glucosamine-1-phosphate N-acetyltransferase